MKTDHAARNETHKSSPPRGSREGQREKDTRETEKEGAVGEDIARHEVSLLRTFVIKIPRLKGWREGRREEEKGRVFSRGSGKKESRVWKNTRFQLKRQA